MNIDGQITRTDDDAFTGYVASLDFDVDIILAPNPHKKKDTHPDYEITGKTPRGRHIRIGVAWTQTSQAGNEYLSIVINARGGDVRVNALEERDTPGTYFLREWATS